MTSFTHCLWIWFILSREARLPHRRCLQIISAFWRTIILDAKNAQPEEKRRMYSNANITLPNPITRKALHPPTPPEYFPCPSKPCRLFLTPLKSTYVDNFPPCNFPHREIRPLKITGKCRILNGKRRGVISLKNCPKCLSARPKFDAFDLPGYKPLGQKCSSGQARRRWAAASGVMSRCGIPSISKPTMNLRTVAERSNGG